MKRVMQNAETQRSIEDGNKKQGQRHPTDKSLRGPLRRNTVLDALMTIL